MSKGCSVCGEWPVVVSQRCHPGESTLVLLHENGTVVVICEKCEKPIIDFQTDLMEEEDESLLGGNIH
jgi:hypothetical protein